MSKVNHFCSRVSSLVLSTSRNEYQRTDQFEHGQNISCKTMMRMMMTTIIVVVIIIISVVIQRWMNAWMNDSYNGHAFSLSFSLRTKSGASVHTNDTRCPSQAGCTSATSCSNDPKFGPSGFSQGLWEVHRYCKNQIEHMNIGVCSILPHSAEYVAHSSLQSRAMHTLQDGSECVQCWSIVSNKWCTQKCLAAVVINHLGPDPANMHEFNVTTMSNLLDFKLD